jgi:Glycosyl hydrolases family 39
LKFRHLLACTLAGWLLAGAAAAQVTVDFGSRSTLATTMKPIRPNFYNAQLGFITSVSGLGTYHNGGVNTVRVDAKLSAVFGKGLSSPDFTQANVKATFDALKASNMKALVVMGYTPYWLQPKPTPCPAGVGIEHAAPTDVNSFAQMAVKFIQWADTNYRGVVTDYEVWNEPDIQNSFCVAGNTDSARLAAYIKLYDATAPAMRRTIAQDNVTPLARVGGPAVVNLGANWFNTFLADPVASQNADFVSYHKYLGYTTAINQGMNWDGAGGHPSLWNLEQSTTGGFAASYKYIAGMVRNGKQPNASTTPIYVTEFNDNAAFTTADCCRNSPTYSPVFNAMYVADMLDTVYSGFNAPAQQYYFAGSVSSGSFCLIGAIDAKMDCATPSGIAVQPYPQYYTYELLAHPSYLNLNAGGRMPVSISPLPSTTGLVVTGFWTSTSDAIVIVNPTNAPINTTVTAKNTGTYKTGVTRYVINAFSYSSSTKIPSSTVTFTVISGGMQYATSIPAYSVVAFKLPL